MYITCFIRDEIDEIKVDLYDQPHKKAGVPRLMKRNSVLNFHAPEQTAHIIDFIEVI